MKRICPYCSSQVLAQSRFEFPIKRAGWYYRKSDRKKVQRYQCRECNNFFSSSTLGLFYNQKKRHFNSRVEKQLAAGVSLRETARVLNLNRKTIARKLKVQGRIAYRKLVEFNQKQIKSKKIQFDDLETFEHTKCKPVTISLAVEEGSRRILDFQVCSQSAKGLLTQKSVLKYGKRKDERPYFREKLLKNIKSLVIDSVQIKTDESTHYIKDIRRIFPSAEHIRYKGRRGCVTGQGELKATGFDPLFSLNHTAAMARYKISRLIRKTWCTTKKMERLRDHFAIMAWQHNQRLRSRDAD